MRLSRPRLVLRVALLALGGGYMLWRALDGHRTAEALQGSDAALAARLALVWGLVGALALVTAATAALSLRRRRRRASLRLGDGDAIEGGGAEGGPPDRALPARRLGRDGGESPQ